jgi:hypothetical protein
MSTGAKVHSIEAIKEFRASLINFVDEARNALGAVDMQINRAVQWLGQDQPLYWKAELKRRQQDMADARSNLHRKRLAARPGDPAKDTEEKEILRVAQRRVEEAEKKLETIKKWIPALQHAISEYQGRARPFGDSLGGEVQRSIELLAKMTTALDAYIAMAPPSMPSRESPSGASTTDATAASTAPAGSVARPEPEPEPSPPPSDAEPAPEAADQPAPAELPPT